MVFFQHFLQAWCCWLHMRKCRRKLNKFVVNTFSSLLAKETEWEVPFSHKWCDMLLQHVHFWGKGGFWKCGPEEWHKFVYFLFCWQGKQKNNSDCERKKGLSHKQDRQNVKVYYLTGLFRCLPLPHWNCIWNGTLRKVSEEFQTCFGLQQLQLQVMEQCFWLLWRLFDTSSWCYVPENKFI